MKATLSILGLYQWDNTLFERFVIPQSLDKQNLIDNLLLELSQLEVTYSDIDFMKFAIGSWSRKEVHIWERLYETTMYEYNPIKNYDKEETFKEIINNTEINNNTQTRDLTNTNNNTHERNLSDKEILDKSLKDLSTSNRNINVTDSKDDSSKTTHSSETSGTSATNSEDLTQESVYAWNQENIPSPKSRTVTESENNNSSTGKVDYETNQEDSSTGETKTTDKDTKSSDTTEKGTVSKTFTGDETIYSSGKDTGTIKNKEDINSKNEREYAINTIGNIGTTTTQQLIKEQREIVELNVMNYIIDSFKCRFCVLVY